MNHMCTYHEIIGKIRVIIFLFLFFFFFRLLFCHSFFPPSRWRRMKMETKEKTFPSIHFRCMCLSFFQVEIVIEICTRIKSFNITTLSLRCYRCTSLTMANMFHVNFIAWNSVIIFIFHLIGNELFIERYKDENSGKSLNFRRRLTTKS